MNPTLLRFALLVGVIPVSLASRAHAQNYTFTTFAGSATVRGIANGAASAARFNTPIGLAVDGANNLYVADNQNHAIRRITPAGDVSTLAGSPGLPGTGAQTLIVGFNISGAAGTNTKPVLIRGVGPSLSAFGLTGLLADPTLTIYAGTTVLSTNDNWSGDAEIMNASTQVGAFALAAATSRAAALLSQREAGSYTIQVTGVGGGTGTTLAEIYDATPAIAFNAATTARLTNVSARTQVGTGANVLIAGFAIGGTTAKTVLIRAVGPTLSVFGVTGVLADPKLELFAGQTVLLANDNWGGAAQITATAASVGAFALPAGSRDAALVATLPPGSYTAQVSGEGSTTGVALVELYEVP